MCQVAGLQQHMIGLSPSVLVIGSVLAMKGDKATQLSFEAG